MNKWSPEFTAWLENLKVGDVVCTTEFACGRVWRVTPYTVTRLTKTLIICTRNGSDQESRFQRKSGDIQGHTGYHWASIEPYTEDLRKLLRINNLAHHVHNHIIGKLDRMTVLQDMTEENLTELLAVFEKVDPKKEAK